MKSTTWPQSTFREDLERQAQDGTEYPFGAIATDLAAIPPLERLRYIPAGIVQYNSIVDSNGCASRAPVAIAKAKLTYFYHHGMHPEIKKWLRGPHMIGGKPYSYIVGEGQDARILVDETFIEILSGTTPTGNSLKAPVHAIHEHGLIPECLPFEPNMSWAHYMDKKRITDEHIALGREFARRIFLGYEQVHRNRFHEVMAIDPLDVAAFAWPEPTEVFQPRVVGHPYNHAFANFTNEIRALDSYEPFQKILAKDYDFFDWGYSLSITNQNPFPDETLKLFEVLQKTGLLAFFAEAVRRLIAKYDPVAPQEPPTETPAPTPTPVPPKPTYLWNTRDAGRHSVRVICDEEGLTLEQKNTLTATVEGESGFNLAAINHNKNDAGKTLSTDWGICQINDHYHIGPGKSFPSVRYVVDNPDMCIRWMCKQWKAGNRNWWIAYKNGSYKKYL